MTTRREKLAPLTTIKRSFLTEVLVAGVLEPIAALASTCARFSRRAQGARSNSRTAMF